MYYCKLHVEYDVFVSLCCPCLQCDHSFMCYVTVYHFVYGIHIRSIRLIQRKSIVEMLRAFMSIIRLTVPCQQILKDRESLLQLVRSTVGLDHRAVGDDAGHQACKGR